MRLLKDELYKIVSQKITRIAFAAVLLIQIFIFFTAGVYSEVSVVNGETYKGFAAIRKDREITREFEGELTDEKVSHIVGKYGFVDFEDEGRWNFNYLNLFIFEKGLNDGYRVSWSDYEIPTKTIPIAESSAGMLLEERKLTLKLSYTQGWYIFEQVSNIGAILVCIFLIIALSPVFAEEYSARTANILLTTVHGKEKDVCAKIGAAFLVAVSSYAAVTGVAFLLCGSVYGFGGLDCLYGSMAGRTWYQIPYGVSVSFLSIGQYYLIMMGITLSGILMLTAFILFASAVAKRTFVSLTVSTIFFVIPAGGWFYLVLVGESGSQLVWFVRRLILCMPLYECMSGAIQDSLWTTMYWYRGISFLVIFLPSLFLAFWLYRNHQAA